MTQTAKKASPAQGEVGGIDLDHMTATELTKLILAAATKRDEKLEKTKAEMLARWRTEAEAAGLSLEAILPSVDSSRAAISFRKKKNGTALPAKYRNPGTGETWSGKGRMPLWLKALSEHGNDREQFLV